MFETIRIGGSGDAPLEADLYLPRTEGPHPLVVAISGGGWVRGHRGSLAAWAEHLVAHGLAVASLDYRRAADGPSFPENAQDVAQGLRHLRAASAGHGLDGDRIAVLGVSAGAHLGALALLSPAFETPKVRGFVGIYGVYDLMAHWQAELDTNPGRGGGKTAGMLGCTPFDDPQIYHDASPLRQITYSGAMPIFLAWGQADREVAPDQSERFARALRQAGYPVRTREIPGAGHLWFSEQPPAETGSHSAAIAPDLIRFLKQTLEVRA